MDRQIRLSPPKLPAIPSPRVSDPTLQRTHDAVREVIETIRGTRGNTLDRAVFVRDLVATGVLSLNASTGVVGPGPSIDTGGSVQADTSIPPLLANIIATAGFSYVLLTWDDPQYAPLSHYEIHRLQVNNPNDSPGYTADDARITVSETSQYNTLLASSSRTPVQTVLMQKLGVLQTRTSEYDYAKSYHLLYPADTALEDAYVAASTALKAARLDVAIAQANNVGSASHIGSTPSPVYSDPVDSGATYLYWVRAVSTSGIVGPFNAVGVSATTQPNVSGVIDELTSEVNRGLVTDLIFNGLDSPSNGLSLLEDLLDLRDIAQNAQQNASDALSTAVSAIPASIWDAINALYNRLANSVLNTLVEDYAQSVDVTTLQDRIASAETTLLEVQNDTGTLAGRIDEYSVQFDEQFAQIGTALVAFADADAAGATQITALESAIYDPATGLQASHGRIDDILDLTLTGDSAFLTALTRIDAELDNTQGSIADILSLQIRPDSALAARLTDLSASLDGVSGQIQDLLSLTITPGSALAQKLTNLELEFAATNARVQDVLELNIDADSVLARALRQIEGNVATASGAVSDLSQLVVEAERVNALKVTRLEGAIDATKGSIEEILDLRVSPTSVLGTKLTAIEAATTDASGKVRDLLSLSIDPASALAGKLTELEAQTDYASGAVSDMLSLRFTSDAIKDSAYANALQSFQLELGNLQSTVQTYTYNVLNDFTDAYGNLTDPVARAGWGVRVEQTANGVSYISGLGLNQDIYEDSQGNTRVFSEFVVAADRFAIIDPSNPDTANNSPFIVGPDPDDPTGPSQVWIRDAMISRAAIKSLTAGSVVADMVRAGAFIQTANLYTPTINIGTWALAPGGDAMDPQDWVYNPAAGRQGNFSVDASGIMHATSAVLNSALIKDGAGNVILDAGNGVYSSALLNDSLYLQAVNGQLTLGGTSNPTNTPITLEAFGARALAAGNVNDWNTTDAAVLAKLPTANAHFFHVRLDKTNKQVAVTLRGINTSSTARARFHLEVVGATVVDPTTAPFNTAQLESTEVPTWSTSPVDFAATSANVIGPNGICITQALGWAVTANGVDQMVFTLSKLDGTVEFRLRLVEFYHASPSDRRMIVLGDSVAVAEFGAAPLEMWFSPRDGSDYDALLLINGPADADATRGAPAGTLVNGVPVENVTTAVTNFNSSNDRNTSAITPAPVIPNTSTAIEHTINADGSANISLDWTWSGTEADIDGFFVQVRRSANQTQVAYTWGTYPAEEVVYQVPANKRAFILFGVPANFRYYFGVRAYRKIDSGLSGANVVNGIVANPLMSAPPVTPAHASASQGYLPSTQVAFTGDIVGTVETAKLNVWEHLSGAKPPSDATRNALTYSASEPAAANGDLWVDTSVTPNVLKVRVSGGWQTASNNTTEIGGSGVNHCHPRYTIFNEAVLPPVANVTRAVATLDSAVGYIGLGALKLEATDADAFCYLGSALGDFNMAIQPARQWIVSAWVMSPTTASAAGQFYIRSDTAQFYGGSFTTSATVGQWTRVSALLSLTANTTSTRAILRLDNDAGAGAVIYFDGIMVEPKVGQLTAPSAFVAPPNFLSTYTGDLNATYGAPAGSLVNGVPVENITAAVTDFNASNNRNATAIAAPTVPADGTAVDHTINTDGSANISFEWAWGGTEGDIDGFLVYSRMLGSSGPYTFGATPADEANETAYQVPANKRAFILFGVPANRYYHFAVRAYRKTDASVAGGLVQSALVQPTYNSSPGNEINGYQPSSSVAFAGDVTGTINGTLNANQVNIWANISGTGRPVDNATKNTVTRSASDPGGTNGDIWIDTTATPHLVKVRVGGNWEISANYLTAGSQLSDYSALSNANITLNPDGTLNNAGSGYVAPFEPYYAAMWDFRSSAGAWAAVNATGTVTGDAYVLTGTATVNPYMRINHGGMSVTGSIYNKVRVKYRRTAGSGAWEGNCYYTTASNTAFSFAYRKTIPSPEATITNGKWYISEWDMENLTAGGTDWVNNVITGLRLDFTSDANETWEVDWVIVGRYGAGEWAMNTINPSNPVTTANIGTYIAQLAVGTLHIGANTVTVPNSATSSTVQQLTPASWTDLLTVAFSVPTVGLSSIDNNVPFILSWAVEADIQNSGAAVRQWQVLKDGVAIYTSNANLLDTEQFCSGVIKDSINAGATVTFKLQGKGVAGVNVYQKSMWVMAARR